MAALAVADQVDEDVLAVAVTVLNSQLADPDDSLRVVTVDVEDRAAVCLGDVGCVVGGATGVRRSGEANLVVHHDVDGTADLVTTQGHEVQGLLDNAQAGEGCVTVQQQRHDGVALFALVDLVLACTSKTLNDRVDGLEVGRVRSQGDVNLALAEHLDVTASSTQVVLDVTRTADLCRVDVAFELGEDLAQWLADDVCEHIQSTAVWHTDDDLIQVSTSSGVNGGVHQRNQRLCALKGEALLTDVLGLQEVLECLGGVQLLQDVLLLSVGRLRLAALKALFQPLALFAVENVSVLGTDLEAVCVAQARKHLAQRHRLLAAETTDVEGAVQIPQGQTVLLDIEVSVVWSGSIRLVRTQRVDVRQQVTAGAVGLNQTHNAGVLVDTRVRQVLCPTDWGVRDTHGLEDVVPELVVDEQIAHRTQELAGLCTLDNAVIVSRGDGHQLADAHLCQTVSGSTSELSRVIHGTDTDNRALALGQARDGVTSADAARVGQGNGDTLEVLTGQLAVASTNDDVLVGVDELLEGQGLTLTDSGNYERTRAVLSRHINGQAEVNVFRGNQNWLAVNHLVVVVHVRVEHDSLHHGVTNDVGEGNLAAAGACQMIVNQGAVFKHQTCRHIANRRSSRHLQGDIHVLSDSPCDALQRLLAGFNSRNLGCCIHWGLLWLRGRRLVRGLSGFDPLGFTTSGCLSFLLRGCCWLCHIGKVLALLGRGVGCEEFAPFLTHRLWILLELLVHLVDQPFVLAEAHVAAHGRYSPLFVLVLLTHVYSN